jgi:predicted ester cyclase
MSTPQEQEHTAITVRRFFEDVFNRADRKVAEEIIAPDIVYYGPDEGIRGIDGLFQIVTVMHNSLQVHFRIEQLIAEDGITAATLTTISGTHVGDFLGIQPQGAAFSLPRVDNFLLENGKIKEVRAVFDHQSMFRTLKAGNTQSDNRQHAAARP